MHANRTQRGATTQPPEQLKLKRLTTSSAGEDAELTELSNIACGAVKWYNHFEE